MVSHACNEQYSIMQLAGVELRHLATHYISADLPSLDSCLCFMTKGRILCIGLLWSVHLVALIVVSHASNEQYGIVRLADVELKHLATLCISTPGTSQLLVLMLPVQSWTVECAS